MAADGETRLALLARQVRSEQLRARPDDPHARSSARILGLPFAPGDPVVDSVTGKAGTVLHVSRRAIPRAAPQS